MARLPEKPISPNVPKIFLAAIAVGLGIGGGLVFLLAFFDRKVRLPEEVEQVVGVPMLVVIPSIVQPAEIRRRRWHAAVTLCGAALCVVLCGAFGVLALNGVDTTIAFVSRLLS